MQFPYAIVVEIMYPEEQTQTRLMTEILQLTL